tara:strand:+ start:130 stop:306 length:177 start_codon:yes stop_codon:yes gene_type:complete
MKKYGFIALAIVIIGIILYVTFIIAVIKITLGLIILAVTVSVLWIIWKKLQNKTKDIF